MRRWALGVVAVVAVLLAWLLVPAPDTGPSPKPRKPAVVAEEEPAAPARPPAPPPGPHSQKPVKSVTHAPQPDAEGWSPTGKNPATVVPPPPSTPEQVVAARVVPPVRKIGQKMSDNANAHPEATALEYESMTLLDDLQKLRLDPSKGDYAELEKREQALSDKLSKLSWYDDELKMWTGQIAQQNAAYHSGADDDVSAADGQ